MTYSIQLSTIRDLLAQHGLLKEIICQGRWIYQLPAESDFNQTFSSVHYQSSQCQSQSLFFCKGENFKEDYLKDALQRGASAYLAETIYPEQESTAIIVTNIRKAMALVCQAFYAYPDQKLNIIGVTATKGKTTTSYFIKDILEQNFPSQVAFITGQDYCVDGKHLYPSALSTPESLDLYGLLSQAVEAGLSYLALEISSQAYKLHRLYGLHLDVGLFLNISPDHVSPEEHPSMEDYFWCKRQIIHQADSLILSEELDQLDFLLEEAQALGKTVQVFAKQPTHSTPSYRVLSDHCFSLSGSSQLDGRYQLATGGQFNQANATAALLACQSFGVSFEQSQYALAHSRVPGRMEEYQLKTASRVIVDFAHNYASLKAVLDYAKTSYPELKRTVVIGSQSHRSRLRWTGIAQALSESANKVYLTADDPGYMKVADISRAIAKEIEGEIDIQLIDDREEAIRTALESAEPAEIIILAGKGTETSQMVNGQLENYAGDLNILQDYL